MGGCLKRLFLIALIILGILYGGHKLDLIEYDVVQKIKDSRPVQLAFDFFNRITKKSTEQILSDP